MSKSQSLSRQLDDYRNAVMVQLPMIIDPTDFQCTFEAVEQCFDDGFTIEDGIAYCRFLEHVNPNIPEKHACQHMAAIARKYPNSKPRSPITTIEGVINELEIQVIMLQTARTKLPLAERAEIDGQIKMARKAVLILQDMLAYHRINSIRSEDKA